MLTLAQYKIKYPNETYLVGSFASHGIGRIISEGFLEFTEDTAPCWGGPFSGNHARFVISDYTNLVFESGPNLGKRKLDVWDENFKEQVKTFTGLTARVILHEYDHIEGKLFIDHLTPLKRKLLKGKLNDITKGKVKVDYKMMFQL